MCVCVFTDAVLLGRTAEPRVAPGHSTGEFSGAGFRVRRKPERRFGRSGVGIGVTGRQISGLQHVFEKLQSSFIKEGEFLNTEKLGSKTVT